MEDLKNYWNNRWVKQPIIYSGRALRNSNGRINTDVRNFIIAEDYILKDIVERYNLKKETYNETAHACQKFVVENLKYKDDLETNGCEEFWQFPFETLVSTYADCEDGAILMASLMINAGIPNWRVKVVGGTVKPQPTAPLGGHAYCIFLADRKSGELAWEIHDWCYYEDSEIPTGEKPLAKDGGYNNTYIDVWFTFNNEFTWSNEEVVIDQQRINE